MPVEVERDLPFAVFNEDEVMGRFATFEEANAFRNRLDWSGEILYRGQKYKRGERP